MTRKTFKNQITSLDLNSKINKKNIRLKNDFLLEKKSRISKTTIKSYDSDLMIFFTWNMLYNENKLFTDIKKIEFSRFFSFGTEDLGWGSSRFARVKSTLSSFSNFIEKFLDEEYPIFKPVILKVIDNLPKQAVREKTVLTDEQVESVFDYLEKDLESEQMACWFALAIASGARFSELLRFTTDIIDPENLAFEGIFMETTSPIKTKGRGKNGRMMNKYIIKDIFLPRYEKWISVRQKILDKNGKDHNVLFIKHNGDPALASTPRAWVKKIEDHLNTDVYAHCFRHFFTTYLAKAGLPIELIQEIGGWKSITMVGLYSDVSAKDRKWEELENLKNISKK